MIQEQKMLGCAMLAAAEPTSEYALWVPRDSPQEWVTATPFNKRLAKTTRDIVDMAVMHYVEQGMFGHIFWRQVMTIVRAILFPGPVDPLCYSSVIMAQDPEVHHGLGLANLEILMAVCVTLGIFAFTALIAERSRIPAEKKCHGKFFQNTQINGCHRSIARSRQR
ncbi:hypothetical protein HDE_00192 [Halotydeus destructor]|nr:hypothetical protein HDE_00192 [Halotydeus destructor]